MAIEYRSPFGENASRIRPFLTLTITTLISILLLWQRDMRSVGKFRNAVLDNPGTASFVKQLIASILGALWVYAGTAFFNLTTRQSLGNGTRTPTLHSLNVWAALGVQRFDFSLSPGFLALSSLIIIGGHAIGSLWGGAITPVVATATWDDGNVIVPAYIADPPWAANEFPNLGNPQDFNVSETDVCEASTGTRGFVPTCPVPGLQNLILYAGSLATTLNNTARSHAKNDNPSWSYLGRSYGAGSSLGITALDTNVDGLRVFNYTEPGYIANTTCLYNSTTNFTLSASNSVAPTESGIDLTLFSASGSLPNLESVFCFPVVLTNQSSTDGVLTWIASNENSRSMLSIASQGYYSAFNQLQCEVQWTPAQFLVNVNVTNQTIIIQPAVSNTTLSVDQPNYLINNVMASLGLIAQTTASIAYQPLGEALYSNWGTYKEMVLSSGIDVVYNSSGINATISDRIPPTSAVEASVNAMIDDILVGFGAAQLSWNEGPNATRAIPASYTSSAVRLGEDLYIWATLVINAILLIVGVEEALRTRFWSHLSPLDYLDLKSIIVAASAGGPGIAEECRQRYGTRSKWNGDTGSKEVAGIRVKLIRREEAEEGEEGEEEEELAMVLAGSKSEKDGSEEESNESRSLTG